MVNENKLTLKQKVKTGIYSALTGLMAVYSTGCGTMNYDIKPFASANSTDSRSLEGKVGIQIGGQDSKTETKCMKAWNVTRSPFYVYRYSDKKWFPEWKEHPYCTTGMTILYGGIAALACGGGSSDKKEPAVVQPNDTVQGDNNVQPIDTKDNNNSTPGDNTPSEPDPVDPPWQNGGGG